MKKSLGAKALIVPTPVWIVCTYDNDKRANGMTVAWGGVCCSDPPCVAVSVRKATYSYGNIVERKAFTVNVPSEEHIRQADYFGIQSGRNEDKFAKAGFTAVAAEEVDAPYISQCPLILECKLLHTIELGLHTQFVGQIVDLKAESAIIDENGSIDIEKAKPVVFAPGGRTYNGIGQSLGKAFDIGKSIL